MPLQSTGSFLHTWARSNPPQVSLDPGSVWSVGVRPFYGYVLNPEPPIILPSKLYGSTERDTQLYLDRWATWNKEKQLAIFLSGKPGSGKTLQAKHTAVTSKLPIILVTQDHANEAFVKFINEAVNTPVCMIFDEFEKVYAKKESQEFFLTVLDGVFAMRNVLMIMTSNTQEINQYMKNRPGRIHYMRDYSGLEPEFIMDYCKDRNLSGHHVKDILKLSNKHEDGFNFDSLQAIVAELQHETYRVRTLKRPERPFREIVSYMNVAGSAMGAHGFKGTVRGALAALFTNATFTVKTKNPFDLLAMEETFPLSIPTTNGFCFVPGVRYYEKEHRVAQSDVVVLDKMKQTFTLKVPFGTWWRVGQAANQLECTSGFNEIVNNNKARIEAKANGTPFEPIQNTDEDEGVTPEARKNFLVPEDFHNPETPSPWLLAASIKPSGLRKLGHIEREEIQQITRMVKQLIELVPNITKELEEAALRNGTYTLPCLDLTVDFTLAESGLEDLTSVSSYLKTMAF